jgi:cation diffusion facilitator family transporter
MITAEARAAERAKSSVALGSVIAAVLLTGFKTVVGFATGSLGILAEALHSALDLGAAVMTYAAVRIAASPPDAGHPYGHGKVESLSALIETILLILTCLWIIDAAIGRLFFKSVPVNPSLWAFVVMAMSMVIDYGRSRALMRAARQYKSQALEADALHFSTDIWSSAVVILGLALVRAGEWLGYRDILLRADAVAALAVAVIVLWVAYKLGSATLDVLLDSAPEGMAEHIAQEVCRVPGVVDCRHVRVRQVGPVMFVDMVIEVPRTMPLGQAHATVSQVEDRVRASQPQADIVAHFEPVATHDEGWAERVQAIAGEHGLYVHDVRVSERGGRKTISLHLEVDERLSLAEAHALANRLEQAIQQQIEGVSEVNTHIEPRMSEPLSGEIAQDELRKVLAALRAITCEMAEVLGCHRVSVQKTGAGLFVSLHCVLNGALPIGSAHDLARRIEHRLRTDVPDILRVDIHTEPSEESPECISKRGQA